MNRFLLIVSLLSNVNGFTTAPTRFAAVSNSRRQFFSTTDLYMSASLNDMPKTLESTAEALTEIILEDERLLEQAQRKTRSINTLTTALVTLASLAALTEIALLGHDSTMDVSHIIQSGQAMAEALFVQRDFHAATIGVMGHMNHVVHHSQSITNSLSGHQDQLTVGSMGGTMEHVTQFVDSAKKSASDVWASYENVLAEHPIRTKALTSATVYTIGDVIAQRTEGAEDIDTRRMLRSLLAGLIGHGPMSHFYYNLNEGFFNDYLHLTAWWSFIPKIFVDQSMFGPIWNNSYIILLGLMKMDSIENIVKDIKETTIPLMVEGLKLWPLVHCITYGLIPVENRLLWVDLVEIVWVTILATKAAEQSKGPIRESAEA